MRDKGNSGTGGYSELPVQKSVLRFVIGRFDGLLEFDGVNNGGCRSNVEDLHDGVVKAVKGGEQVQISGNENDQKEFVSSERYP